MNYTLITSKTALENTVQTILGACPPLLAIDTEFMRKSTYWPQLCLIQMAFGDHVFIVDALALEQDLQSLKAIFDHKNIKKIFHSGRQDLEILFHLWGSVPANIADTQVLGMVTGFGDSISYEKINEFVLGKKIDKSQQHTDWAKRPLSEKQLIYAATDVRDLCTIYTKLQKKAGSKAGYIKEEIDKLSSETTYKPNINDAWLKIKCKRHTSSLFWGRLQAMAALRENEASQQNKAKNHLLKDEVLVTLASAKAFPHDILKTIKIKDSFQKALEDTWAKAIPQKRPTPPFLETHQEDALDLLKILLRHTSLETGIAPRLIATKDALQHFILSPENSPLLSGWRHEVFGNAATHLLQGQCTLGYDPQKKGLHIRNT